jgi:cell wall-associated NlpC family hydrolase
VTFTADNVNTGVYVAKGATTSSEAKEALVAAAAKEKITLLDSIKLLPDPALGEKIYGITYLSVANSRNAPDHENEMDTQTLMGMPMRILEKRGSWLRIVTPEGYISWSNMGVQAMTKAEYDAWNQSDKMIITTHYTLFRAQPSPTAAVVRDGVWGCVVQVTGVQGSYYKVVLPDGKTAFVPKEHAQKFDDWVTQRNPTAANIVATARQFLGFPYLWGGTSIKAVDCSGFVKSSFYLNGVIIPRDASQQVKAGEEVDITNGIDNLQPADILFFGSKATEKSPMRVTHVGLYIGNGQFIHSNSSAASVTINSLIKGAPDYTTTAENLVCSKRFIHLIDIDKEIVSIAKHPWDK